MEDFKSSTDNLIDITPLAIASEQIPVTIPAPLSTSQPTSESCLAAESFLDVYTPPVPFIPEFSQSEFEFNFAPSTFPIIKPELIKRQGVLSIKRKEGWRSRWCILTTGFLFLFKEEKAEVKEMIKVSRVESAGKSESRKKHVFSILSGWFRC